MQQNAPTNQDGSEGTQLPIRPFGDTGDKLTSLGFGTAPIGLSGYQDPSFTQRDAEKESVRALEVAIERGIRFFDTAPAYANKVPTGGWSTDRASERILGQVVVNHDREKLFLASKNMFDRMDPAGIRDSINETLRLLNTDYLDLFQVHGIIAKPFRADNWREFVTDEVMRTFEDLRQEGKTRYIGISGYREGALSAIIESGLFDAVMPQFNYFYRGAEWELVHLAKNRGVAVIPMRPLTGRLIQETVGALVDGPVGDEPLKLVMSYLLQFEAVASLPIGMRTVEEVEHNCRLINEVEAQLKAEQQ